MVTGPESRILARLHTFSSTLESAWDVPRDICLPGLSEYLGVVRSALHAPLSELVKKGMVTERKAHVIGGGSRKERSTISQIWEERNAKAMIQSQRNP